jgi:serine/threonine-protein kinase ULK4
MDKYHIYEEIGKGGFSQVFKGREKRKIEYVSLHSVSRSASLWAGLIKPTRI